MGIGREDDALCDWGIKMGESITCRLVYAPSQPDQSYPKWSDQ
jgi:hypothetical protein